jgi:hypothetical protein
VTFQEQYSYVQDSLFRKRVHVATMIAAVAVQGEAQGVMTSGEFNKRQILATKMITTGGVGTPAEDLQRMFVWAAITNPVISPASDDGEIQFVINSVWSDCAGVTGTEV